MEPNMLLDTDAPRLPKEQRQQIRKVTDRYLRMQRNRIKRRLIGWMKIHKN